MKPGDTIEWVYGEGNYKDTRVLFGEQLWSRVMYQYVPINGNALLIGLVGETMTWLSAHGLFSAYTTDRSYNSFMSTHVKCRVIR